MSRKNRTAEVVEIRPMTLLPPKPGVCQTCAVDHKPHLPHDPTSMYYQVKFKMEHGRGANWLDAMDHCDANVKDAWQGVLTETGIDYLKGEIRPRVKAK